MLTLDDLEPRRIGRLWIWPDGTTLPVISGGDGPTDDDNDTAGDDDTDTGDDTDDDGAGDDDADSDGKASTEPDWKHRARQWERRAKANARRLEAAEAASKTDYDKAIDEAKSAGKAEAHTKLAGRLFVAELRDLAKDKLAVPASLLRDPQVALTMLELDELPVDDDGEIDTEAISDAIDVLIKREPDLAVKPAEGDDGDGKGKPTPKAPKVPGGPRGTKPKALADHTVDDFRDRLRKARKG